jgi:hypothetical protein
MLKSIEKMLRLDDKTVRYLVNNLKKYTIDANYVGGHIEL